MAHNQSTGFSSGTIGVDSLSEYATAQLDLTNPAVLSWDNTPDSLLGKGTFGEVYRCQLIGTDAAVKIVKEVPRRYGEAQTSTQAAKAKMQLEREVRRLSQFRFPHITQYLGAAYDERRGCTLLVTELMAGGSLQSSLARARSANAPLAPKTFFQIAIHIASGLRYLHLLNISHGDIKPANILLTDPVTIQTGRKEEGRAVLARNAKVKLADFGMSLSLHAEPSGPINATMDGPVERGIQGTLAYLAPEGFAGGKPASSAAAKALDIYAMGIVLYDLLSGCEPWAGYTSHALLGAMNRKDEVTRPKWPNRASMRAASMASAASRSNPPALSVGDSTSDPWMQSVDSTYSEDTGTEGRTEYHRCLLSFELVNAVEMTERCWAQNPDDRPTANELVDFFSRQDKEFDDLDFEFGGGGGAGPFVRVDTQREKENPTLPARFGGAGSRLAGVGGGRPAPPRLQVNVDTGGPATMTATGTAAGGATYYRQFFESAQPPTVDQVNAGMSRMNVAPNAGVAGMAPAGGMQSVPGAGVQGGVHPGWPSSTGGAHRQGTHVQVGHPAAGPGGGYAHPPMGGPPGAYVHHGGPYGPGQPPGVSHHPVPSHAGVHTGAYGGPHPVYNSFTQPPQPPPGTSLPDGLAASASGGAFPFHSSGPGGRSLVPNMRVPPAWQMPATSSSADDSSDMTNRCRRLARAIYQPDPVHAHDAIAGLADVTEDKEQALWLVSSAPAVVKRLCWALNWDLRAETRSPALAHDVCAVLSNMAGVCAMQPATSKLASVLTTPEHASAIVGACVNALSTYSGVSSSGPPNSAVSRPEAGNERVCAAAADALGSAFQRRDVSMEAHPGDSRVGEISRVLRDVLTLAVTRRDPDLTRAAVGATCSFVRLFEPAAREVALVGPNERTALAVAFTAVTELGGEPGGSSGSASGGGGGGSPSSPTARVDLEGFGLLASVAFFPVLRPGVLFAGGTAMLRTLLGRHRGSPTWRSAIVTALSTLLGGWGQIQLREPVRQRALTRFAADGGCAVAVLAVRLCVDAKEGGGGGADGNGPYGLATGSRGSSLSASGSGGGGGGSAAPAGGAVAAAAQRPVLVRRLELLSLQVLRMLYRRDPGLLQMRVLEAGGGEAVLLLLRSRGGGLVPEAALEGVLILKELTGFGWRGDGAAPVLRELAVAYGSAGGVGDACAEALKVVAAAGRRLSDSHASK